MVKLRTFDRDSLLGQPQTSFSHTKWDLVKYVQIIFRSESAF